MECPKESKFLASRWLIYLSTEMLIKEYNLTNDTIVGSLDTTEYFIPPYKLATNKSSFLGHNENFDEEVIKELKEVSNNIKDFRKKDKRLIKERNFKHVKKSD